MMIWLAILLLLEIIILSLLRKSFITGLALISLLIFKTSRPGYWLYAVIMFPGTVIHELSHWFVAELLQVRTGEFRLLPQEGQDEHVLGSVATSDGGALKGAFIGIAPFIIGLFALTGLGFWLAEFWPWAPVWQIFLAYYGVFTIGNSIFLSRADLRSWPVLVVILTLASLIIYYSQLKLSFLYRPLVLLDQILGVTVIITFAMILMLYIVRRVLEHATRKRISR